MEEKEIERGIISEEALDDIAGGLNIDKAKLIKGLKYAGVAIIGAGALASAGYGMYKWGEKRGTIDAATVRKPLKEGSKEKPYDPKNLTLEDLT